MSKRKNDFNILLLKLSKEDKIISESQLVEGNEDLNYRISKFRKKFHNEEDVKKFDSIFYKKNDKDTSISEIKSHNNSSIDKVLEKESLEKQENWIKKIYKKIMIRTHPDKFINVATEEIKQKYTKIYIDAVEAFNSGDEATVLVCAYDCDISLPEDNFEDITRIILEKINFYKSEILKAKQQAGYFWYHLSENEKEKFLEDYLKKLGYDYSKRKIRTVVKEVRSRKTGTKPVKRNNVKRNTIK